MPTSLNNVYLLNANTNALVSTLSPTLDSNNSVPFDATAPSGVCIRTYYYSVLTNINYNPSGYYLSFQYSSFYTAILNYNANSTLLWTLDLADPRIVNSTPEFIDLPGHAYFCLNNSKNIDFSCTDSDGDSLVYSLSTSYSSAGTNGSKPYNPVPYSPGYSLANLIGSSSSISINSSTGIVTANATMAGSYLIGVICEEYRGGVKIGQVRRDIVLTTSNSCPTTNIHETSEDLMATIFPNPSNGLLNIKLSSNSNLNTTIEVFNITDSLLNRYRPTGLNNQISIEETGTYFIKVSNKNKVITKKVIIQ